MPFKGDMRLGGRHSNVATLNGTASDLVSVPAAGTVLSGPTDTSRYVNDFLGTPFYIPYSTTVYADGLGGQNSVETWGLQYLPAGWVTTTSQDPQYLSWDFVTEFDNLTTSGTIQWGYNTLNHIEDGTGINYTSIALTTETIARGSVLASSDNGTGADRYRVVFNPDYAFSDALFQDFTMYPVLGTNLGGANSGHNYITTPCSSIIAGGWGNPDAFADGYGSSYDDGSSYSNYDDYPAGSFLEECNGEYLYSSGSGNYHTGFAPLGWPISTSYSYSLHWQSPNFNYDNIEGDFNYSAGGCSGTADGYGGMNNPSCGGWNAALGDPITNGMYYYQVGTGNFDENNSEIMENHQVVWSYTYNGDAGYNVTSTDNIVG